MTKDSIWNEELVEKLKNLYLNKNMTTVEIAKELGLTKNAIIGKIHRLQLNLLKTDSNSKADSSLKDNSSIKENENKKIKKMLESRGISLDDLDKEINEIKIEKSSKLRGKYKLSDIELNMCVWPYGDDKFTFCGDPVVVGRSYCKEHLDLVYFVTKKISKKKYADAADEEAYGEVEDLEDKSLESV